MFKVTLFLCLVALVVARDKHPCEVEHKVGESDWKSLNTDPAKPSDKMLCLFKCFHEKGGDLNAEGVIDVEKLIENVNKKQPLTDADKTTVRECMKGVGPIKTCLDVAPSYHCVRKVFTKKAPPS